MGLDIFFREDIAHALDATRRAAAEVAKYLDDTAQSRAFCAGWDAALDVLAAAFGLPQQQHGDVIEGACYTVQALLESGDRRA